MRPATAERFCFNPEMTCSLMAGKIGPSPSDFLWRLRQ